MPGPDREVVVRDDANDLARHVAAALLDLVEQVQAAGDVPDICLTGGTIADAASRAVLAIRLTVRA